MKSLVDDVTDVDPIGGKLMYTMLYENVNAHPILHYYGAEAAESATLNLCTMKLSLL